MTEHATSTFEVKRWDEQTLNDVDGRLKMTRASVGFAYHGELEGESAMEYLMLYRDDSGATVIGLERISGQLNGRSGSFAIESRGGYEDGVATGEFTVIPGSGTGQLEGIHGRGKASAGKDGSTSFSLEYNLPR